MRALQFAAPATLAALLALSGAPAAAQDAAGHIAAGNAARCERNSQAALMHFREALALDSLNYEANWRAARELADIGKLMPDAQRKERDSVYAASLELARRAVRVDSMGADGHYMVAVAAGRVALTKSAHERVKSASVVRDAALRAIALDPRHDGAMHVMGRWNAEIMRLPGLTKFFARTFLGASVFKEASWDNSVKFFSDAIQVNPQVIYHHLDFAEALIDADRPAEAKPHLEEVARLPLGCDVGDPTYQQRAAELLQRLNRQ
jgi:tetratricopeptide (TPR) repeat protein